MSWKAVDSAFQRSNLTPTQKLVLVALAYRCNQETGLCNPSIARIAQDTGYSERGVQKIILALEQRGVLIVHRSDGGRMQTNHYEINPEHGSGFKGEKPRTPFTVSEKKPRTSRHKTPNVSAQNPEPRSPEPVLTVLEPEEPPLTPPREPTQEDSESPAIVPVNLNREAWDEYIAYRRERKLPKLKSMSVNKLMRFLVKQPDQAAVVDQTIRNGWQGLFELKEKGQDHDGPIKGSYDWYRERAEKRVAELDGAETKEFLDGDDPALWPALDNRTRRNH